jgi:hypothetical protein
LGEIQTEKRKVSLRREKSDLGEIQTEKRKVSLRREKSA